LLDWRNRSWPRSTCYPEIGSVSIIISLYSDVPKILRLRMI
jgi:hypothetical protein